MERLPGQQILHTLENRLVRTAIIPGAGRPGRCLRCLAYIEIDARAIRVDRSSACLAVAEGENKPSEEGKRASRHSEGYQQTPVHSNHGNHLFSETRQSGV